MSAHRCDPALVRPTWILHESPIADIKGDRVVPPTLPEVALMASLTHDIGALPIVTRAEEH